MTKTITDSQIIGAQGESFVSERAHAMGFMFSRYGPVEAGIDGFLEIRDPETNVAKGQLVAVQVKTKASGSYTAETESGFEYLMDTNDVAYWKGCNLPVIIVLVHLGQRSAFWKNVDAGEGSDNRRLHIDKSKDVFDVDARDRIINLCVNKGGFGVYFPPFKTNENGHLNMLEVLLPESIFVAMSPFKNGRHALWELLNYEDRPPDDWVIKEGQLLSFRNPKEGPLSHIVDTSTVEKIATEDIAFPEDEADEYRFIELLRRTLGAQLDGILAFNREQRAFYFTAIQGAIERVYVYRSLKQHTSAKVVKRYAKDGKLKYIRHNAFEPRFWRIGERWLLSVTPTFVFTWDGFHSDKFASGRLAGKKQREFNSSLMGQFAMWRHLLVNSGETDISLFEPNFDRERVLNFKVLNPLSLPSAVPDDVWRSTDVVIPENDRQESLAI